MPTNTLPPASRMPAEWESHAATWLAWPHNANTWPGLVDRLLPIWCDLAKAIAPGEEVHILVNDAEMETAARRLLRERRADSPNVHLHIMPTNDAWMRDQGPIFVKDPEGKVTVLDWEYNSWGEKYPPWDLDNTTPERIATLLGLPRVKPGIVLEGGSIDTNGNGLLLTTEQCLLNPNRNPHLSKAEIEKILCANLGVSKILWLGDGVEGDDTDGHVDDITRFISEDTVITVVEPNPRDENHLPLKRNLEKLHQMSTVDGHPLNIVELPMPYPVYHQGDRLPASYANFYICNAAVLVPMFDGGPRDAEALEILTSCFPDREVVGIRAVDLVWGLGTFHCISQQQPAG